MENHLILEEPVGSMLTAKVHVFPTQFSALVLGGHSTIRTWEKKAEAVTNSDSRKNRSDIAGGDDYQSGQKSYIT